MLSAVNKSKWLNLRLNLMLRMVTEYIECLTGSIREIIIESSVLNREVSCVLYLPDLKPAAEPLHLLLINDGQDLDKMQYSSIVNDLYQSSLIDPVLTVGIKAGEERQLEYGIAGRPDFKNRGSKADQYNDFIIRELLPAIFEQTSILSFASYAIAGFSLGGLSAFDIAWNNSDTFKKVGTFSASYWWRTRELTNGYTDQDRIAHQMVSQTEVKPELTFWFQVGTEDEKSDRNQNGIIDAIDDNVDLMAELHKKGFKEYIDIRYVELIDGRHDIETWGRMMPVFLKWAFSS